MISKIDEHRKEKRDIRMVFLVFSLFFSVIAWKNYPSNLSFAFSGLVVVQVLTLIFKPILLRPVFRVWLKVTHFIGKVNTQIILTLLYYLVFTPYGLVMRLFGRDSMQRKLKSTGTYWESFEFEGLKDKTRYEKQF
ncbi:hypothetical protein IIA28_19270 [candidate division KSB1 bacterium]|nr:hypothetical protein [candidate division KSB1 bacterium]